MKKFLTVIAVLGISLLPTFAKAADYSDNFDDGVMNPDLWTYTVEGTPANTNLYESGGVLNFTATGSSDLSSRHYVSKWVFDLNNDFAFRADFNYPYSATSGAVEMGLFRGDPLTEDSFIASIEAASDGRDSEHIHIFQMGVDAEGGWSVFDRDITTGWLGIRYDASADLLQFGVFNPSDIQVVGAEYSDFKSLGTEPLGVFIGGYSDGAVLAEGQANLDNFQATAAPEPVSTILFLTGGAVMAVRRLRRK